LGESISSASRASFEMSGTVGWERRPGMIRAAWSGVFYGRGAVTHYSLTGMEDGMVNRGDNSDEQGVRSEELQGQRFGEHQRRLFNHQGRKRGEAGEDEPRLS
jgi:hypothetical protein